MLHLLLGNVWLLMEAIYESHTKKTKKQQYNAAALWKENTELVAVSWPSILTTVFRNIYAKCATIKLRTI